MNTTIYSLSIRSIVSIVFISCFFSFASATSQTLIDTSPLVEHQAATPNTPLVPTSPESALLNPIFKIFYAAIKNIKGLNYYTATGLVLPLPGTDQEVVFHWGFKGSGSIFTPLPNIKATVRPALLQRLQQHNPSNMKELGFALLQNELLKYSKNTQTAKWLTQANLNPLTLFGLKLILLVKTTLDASQTRSTFHAELMRLLFRLSLTDDFKLLDQQPLSSLIPTELKNILQLQIPGCVEFIDDLWAQRTATPTESKTAYYNITCFVFRDKDFAEKIQRKMSSYQGAEFTNYATQLINLNQHQVVDLASFTQFSNSQTLVGFLSTTHTNHKHLPTAVAQAITQSTSFPVTQLIATETGEQWLCFATDQLGITDTIKEVMLSLTKAFRTYIERKKELLTSKNAEAVLYQSQQQQQKHAEEVINNFIETEDGAASFERLSQAVTSIVQPEQVQPTVVQKLTTLKSEQTTKIQGLEKQREAITADLERWEILKNITKGKDNVKIQITIKKLQKLLDEVAAEIAQAHADLTKLSADLSPMSHLEQDHKQLAALLTLVEQQQNQGITPSEKLVSAIELLQNKIKNATTNSSQQVDVDVRLSKRAQVAQVLASEATTMEKQLQEKLAQINQIADEEQRTIQELLFSQEQEGYATYIQQLKAEAQRINEQNKKAQELKRYKKALTVVDLSQTAPEQSKKIYELEKQVGHLFTSQQDENVLENIRCSHPEIKALLADLQGDQSHFLAIKTALIDAFGNILQHSQQIQNNAVLFQYGINMLNSFAPGLFSLLAPLVTNIA